MATLNGIMDYLADHAYGGYDETYAVDIKSYDTIDNQYTVPQDGLVRIECSYRSGSYVAVNVDSVRMAQLSAPQTVNTPGVQLTCLPVFKGQKIRIATSTNTTENKAHYIPFTIRVG